METIDIQNKSFVVRWVKCARGDTINYQVKPLKKSIELGIYKHLKNDTHEHLSSVHIAPDVHALLDYTTKTLYSRSNPTLTSSLKKHDTNNSDVVGPVNSTKKRSGSTNSEVSSKSDKPHRSLSINNIQKQSKEIPLLEKLDSSGFSLVNWVGHVTGNSLIHGDLKVLDDDYYYAFILDNTTSKNSKKKVLFNASIKHNKGYKPEKVLAKPLALKEGHITSVYSSSSSSSSIVKLENDVFTVGQGRYLQGYLFKKQRKRLQGFKKRFFSLDYKYGTLSYYLNDHNQTCRGEIVISLSSVSANKKDRLIIIDSGMEIWVLKANNQNNWQLWVNAIQSCFDIQKRDKTRSSKPKTYFLNESDTNNKARSKICSFETPQSSTPYVPLPSEKYVEFTTTLRLVKQKLECCKLESKSYVSTEFSTDVNLMTITSPSSSLDHDDNINNLNYQKSNMQSADSSASDLHLPLSIDGNGDNDENDVNLDNQAVHHLYKKLAELESFVDQFISQSFVLQNDHQIISRRVTENRLSATSGFSDDEYFDAEEGIKHGVMILPDDAVDVDSDIPIETNIEDNFLSEISVETIVHSKTSRGLDVGIVSLSQVDAVLEVNKVNLNLYPLPLLTSRVKHRNDIKPALTTPPSLLSFLRKNVGKDLSSVAMPVSANEPISIIQMISESFEYSDILSKVSDTDSRLQPLSIVSAFAISTLSIHRDKTRAMRKPFNPLLGETFELVSDEMQFRLIAEKVSHKPQIFAFHAEHENWECSYTVSPVQKFWGKSVELNNEGIMKLTMKTTGETYEWAQPTTMLKNLIAGERYMEPVDEFKICCSNGGYSNIAFRSAGMFGGRSEDLTISVNPSKSEKYNKETLVGKWTDKVKDQKSGKEIWKVKELVPNSKKKYGFTKFTANLNEITDIERGNLPPTDSRYRPDIKAYENGNIDEAETLKLKLELAQRERRNEGTDINPNYFKKVSDKKWEFIKGPNGYWERREQHDWSGIIPLW